MDHDLVKISFKLNSDSWHGYSIETLWGKLQGGNGKFMVFELENSPFYAKGVSYRDSIRAANYQGHYEFSEVVSGNGHSTYRLFVEDDVLFETWWRKLKNLGCSYESGTFSKGRLFAVDVPASTDIFAVYKVLEEGEANNIWIFEEGHVGHPLQKSG